jgi:hypothetical protein
LEAELISLDILKEVINEHLYNLSEDNIRKHEIEIGKLITELNVIKNTTEKSMYLSDVDEVLLHIKKYYAIEPVINVNNEKLIRISA